MIKIVTIALICSIIIVYLKTVNSEVYMLALVATGIILISFGFEYLSEVFTFANRIMDKTGIDKELYKIIFKIIAIGYLIEFAASTINDFGLKSIADKLVFVGKIIIFSVSMPILYAVFNLLSELI